MRSEIAASLDERAQNTNCTGVQQQLVDHDRDGASCSANTDGESLEDLIRSLHRQIKDSDWLFIFMMNSSPTGNRNGERCGPIKILGTTK